MLEIKRSIPKTYKIKTDVGNNYNDQKDFQIL